MKVIMDGSHSEHFFYNLRYLVPFLKREVDIRQLLQRIQLIDFIQLIDIIL